HETLGTSSYINLAWTAVSGATSYTVLCNGQAITTSSTSATVSGLDPLTYYPVTVYANNSQAKGFASYYTAQTADNNTGGGGGGGGDTGGVGPCGDIVCASNVGPTHEALHTQPTEQAGTDNALNHVQASAIASAHPSLPTSNRPKTIIPETIIPETIIPEHIKASGKSVRAFTVLWIHHFLIETN
ncbi:MAG: fibronectin type III domain-containing protein, partial [Tumebacillaceae bacterium]